MLTYRKAAVLGLFILAAVYLLHSSHSTAASRATLADDQKLDFETSKQQPKTTGVPPSSEKLSRPYPPPRKASNTKDLAQQPLTEVVTTSLRDRLQYQFPYDRAGNFQHIFGRHGNTRQHQEISERPLDRQKQAGRSYIGFVHEVVTDDAAVYLLKHLYASVPEVIDAYTSLPLPVMKADFFRYLILLARGVSTQTLTPRLSGQPQTGYPAKYHDQHSV